MFLTGKYFRHLFLITTAFLLLPGYVIQYYLGLETNILFAVSIILCVLIVHKDNNGLISRRTFAVMLSLCLIGSIGTFFSKMLSQLLMTVSLASCFFVASSGWRIFVDQRTLNYLMILSWILIGGATIGLVYAFAGGPPLVTIDLFGRESYFYLSTFTNAVTGNLIRPAGIFDEPGALAMFITLVVALNEALISSTKKSATLLVASFVTGSFALVFVGISYLLIKVLDRKFSLVILIVLVVSTLLYIEPSALNYVENIYLKRMVVVDGQVSGDNRTHQIKSFFELVDWDITMSGSKAAGLNSQKYDLSSNPFSIYFSYGIFVWTPYLLLQIWLLYCVIRYRPNLRFPALALFLTLLQRPYIYNLHWGMMIAVVVVTIYRVQKMTIASTAEIPSASPVLN